MMFQIEIGDTEDVEYDDKKYNKVILKQCKMLR